jgi:competence protein ComEC
MSVALGERQERRGAYAVLAAALTRITAAQEGRFFLWSPVLLAAGIALYFALPIEPPMLVFILAAAAMVFLAAIAWRWNGGVAAKIVCVLIAGFLLAKARTELVAAPAIPASTGKVTMMGTIEEIDRKGPRSAAMTMKIASLEGEGIIVTPERIRLTASMADALPPPGTMIKASGRLFPLPTPSLPGGYDHGRTLWFDGIGATARAFGKVEVLGTDASWSYWLSAHLHSLREAMGARIRAVLPKGDSGFAEALITGERGTIPKAINDSLQVSGLAHILSISGLHMSLVAGGVFWLIRALLALSPALAIRHPIKKWAAIGGLITGFAYMLLAGTSVATQRSYVMIAIMFIAVLIDRPALSMRNLAIAGLIVLIIAPEAALTASLQMSFMAVIGLLAFHDVWSRWLTRTEGMPDSWGSRALRFGGHAILAMACTTLAAGLMSSIPAAHHFGRLAPYSLLANLLALPVVSILVMPMALLAVLLMPFGLEALPLLAMNAGLDLIVAISDWVGTLPAASGQLPALPAVAAILLAAGGVSLCLFRGSLRFIVVPLGLAGVATAAMADRPALLIERTARNVAIVNDEGHLVPALSRRGRFAVEQWLRDRGDDTRPAQAAKRKGWTCKANLCEAVLAGKRVVFIREDKLSPALPCAEADILIADFPLRGRCRSVATRIDRFDVWRHGAHAVSVGANGIEIATASAARGLRPWVIAPVARRKTAAR